jgi:hypothetical protein
MDHESGSESDSDIQRIFKPVLNEVQIIELPYALGTPGTVSLTFTMSLMNQCVAV